MKRVNKTIIAAVLLVSLLSLMALPVFSAVISGNVYGPDFELINDIVVKINSKPAQQYLVKNGSYEFSVPTGSYVLTADNVGNVSEKYTFSEKVEVSENGNYTIDVLLIPDVGSDIAPFPENIYMEEPTLEETMQANIVTGIIIIAALIVIGLIVFFVIRAVKKKDKRQDNSKNSDESYEKILALIKKNKRMTQKDITKEVFLSDAKVSLVLTDMESKGIIRKIKKGRTNVIIWNK